MSKLVSVNVGLPREIEWQGRFVRTGVCHVCECGLLDGRLRYAPEPLDPPAIGNALICCSTPASEVELDL